MTVAQRAAPGREYETIYVLRPDITKEGAEKVSTRVADVMQRTGGKLTLVESWGRRTLAFPLGNYRRAYYVYLKYLGGGAVVSELERNFRMLDTVLKYQTVKLRDEVDVAAVQVNAENVEFEAIEPPGDDEVEETLAEQLGLVETMHDGRGEGGYGHGHGRGAPSAPAADEEEETAVEATEEEEA